MSRAILGLTRKKIKWNMYIEYVAYTFVDNFLVMSFIEETSCAPVNYYMIWRPSGEQLKPTVRDILDNTDTHTLWLNIADAAEKREFIYMQSLADMKPSNEPVPIMMTQSLSDIDVNITDRYN